MKSTKFGEMNRTDEIEKAKISRAKKLFNGSFTSGVEYHDVDSYQSLLTVMGSFEEDIAKYEIGGERYV